MKEYRVIWKRKDWMDEEGITVYMPQKVKRYVRLKSAERFIRLLTSQEPWLVLGLKPENCSLCNEDHEECLCDSLTVKESFQEKYANVPPIEFVRIEHREVGKWSA